MPHIRKLPLLAAAVLAGLSCAANAADEGKWMVRVRAVNLAMQNESAAGSNALTPALLPANAVRASNKTIPEVDFTYFFTKNIAAELILTYPQKHTVSINDGPLAEGIGGFKQLPPTLTLQYHFFPDAQFRPYIGGGFNYTKISGVGLRSNIAGADLGLEGSSTGGALQAGMDIKLQNNLFLNIDIKKIYIESDITVNGRQSSHIKLDPVAVGIGLGWRF